VVVDLIQNAALLIALSALYGIFGRLRKAKPLLFKILTGFWFGAIAIAGMVTSVELQPGTIFDGRSIVMSLAGLFGGGITSIISIIIASAYRIYLGGTGVWVGVITIILSAGTGLFFRRYFGNKPEKINLLTLFIIGFVVHVVMLASQLLLPWPLAMSVISRIWVPVLLVFPAAFVLMSVLFGTQEQQIQGEQLIRDAELLYRTTLYSIGDGVITTDNQSRIKHMNPIAEELTGWKEADAFGKPLDEVFMIINETTGEAVESTAEQVFKQGSVIELATHSLLLSKDDQKKPIADSGAPIKDEHGNITGVVLVFRDQSEERAKQKMLELSETKYRELVESTDAIAWEYHITKDQWAYLAPQVTDKLGWHPNEWKNFDFWIQNIHPDDRKRITESYLACVERGECHAMEYRFRTKDGKYLWLRDVITAEAENNKPVKLRGVMLDITGRKQAELDLREKNDFIQTVLDFLPIGVALNKIDEGTAFYTNHKFEEIYGWKANELKDIQSFFEKVYPDKSYRKELVARIMTDINSGKPERMHWENIAITRANGEKAMINAVNIPLFEQNMMVSTVMDVTLQKEAEKALMESEEQFRKLFENHTAVHLLIEPKTGAIINANQAASEFYGWPIEKLKKMRIQQINEFSEEEINQAINVVLKTKNSYFEFKHRLSNGQIRFVEVFTSKIELKGKDYLYSIVHDITEKKELFNEVVKAKEKAEESDRLKSAFLANMSHEIRTPLNGILGFTGLLTRNVELAALKRKEYSTIINRSAESLMRIIDDILDLSKLETGQLVIDKKRFCPNETIKGLRTLFQKKLDDKGKTKVILNALIPDESIVADADENRLNQVFINLLDNALKFTDEGLITFGVTEVSGNQIRFFVSDTGIGITKEKQSIIFDRFTQADLEISRNYGGTGLGLSIVKNLIELMGGEITVESEPGKGTIFSFYLPYAGEVPLVGKKNELKKESQVAHKQRILLVEDDPISCLFYQELLDSPDIELLIANSGKEALLMARNHKLDVIMMDIRLPDANGLEIVKEIRKFDRQVRIIAQTANAMIYDEKKAIEAGCNDYISKPVNPDILFQKLGKD